MACILIIEDDELTAIALSILLTDRGHQVCGLAATAKAALREARRCSPDLALVDGNLRGERGGLDITPELTAQGIPCVIVSAHVTAQEAYAAGAVDWVPKPYTAGDIAAAITRVKDASAQTDGTTAQEPSGG